MLTSKCIEIATVENGHRAWANSRQHAAARLVDPVARIDMGIADGDHVEIIDHANSEDDIDQVVLWVGLAAQVEDYIAIYGV